MVLARKLGVAASIMTRSSPSIYVDMMDSSRSKGSDRCAGSRIAAGPCCMMIRCPAEVSCSVSVLPCFTRCLSTHGLGNEMVSVPVATFWALRVSMRV